MSPLAKFEGDLSDPLVLYVAHPLGNATQQGIKDNLNDAMRWLSWLRKNFPETVFIAPWISACLAGADDADPAQRELGLRDARTVIEFCDGIVLTGAAISSGMIIEANAGIAWRAGPDNSKGWSPFVIYDFTGWIIPEAIIGRPVSPFSDYAQRWLVTEWNAGCGPICEWPGDQ